MFTVEEVKTEYLVTNEASPDGVKSIKLRLNPTTSVVTFVVAKPHCPVQVFTNLPTAVKKYNE